MSERLLIQKVCTIIDDPATGKNYKLDKLKGLRYELRQVEPGPIPVPAADSRATAEVLEGLKRDVLALVDKNLPFAQLRKRISRRFDAALAQKEPTKQ